MQAKGLPERGAVDADAPAPPSFALTSGDAALHAHGCRVRLTARRA